MSQLKWHLQLHIQAIDLPNLIYSIYLIGQNGKGDVREFW